MNQNNKILQNSSHIAMFIMTKRLIPAMVSIVLLLLLLVSCGAKKPNGTYTAANGNSLTFTDKELTIQHVTEYFEINDSTDTKLSSDSGTLPIFTYKISSDGISFSHPMMGPFTVPFRQSGNSVFFDDIEYIKN